MYIMLCDDIVLSLWLTLPQCNDSELLIALLQLTFRTCVDTSVAKCDLTVSPSVVQ